MKKYCPLFIMSWLFVGCIEPDSASFSIKNLVFSINSILKVKSSVDYYFDYSVGSKSTYGPSKNDGISLNISAADEITKEIFVKDSFDLIGGTSGRYFILNANKNRVLMPDSAYPVILALNFYEHGRLIRNDTLRSYLQDDSNQYLDSNYLEAIQNYTEDLGPLFYQGTCKLIGNKYQYDYRMYDSVVNKNGTHLPGFFAAIRVSNADSTFESNGGYTSLARTLTDTGETPSDHSYSSEHAFSGDSPHIQVWVIFGKKFYYTESVCK